LTALPPPPDLGTSVVVRGPERPEVGYWSGAPAVLVHDGRFWLTYRERRPRGVAPERGWRCAIAVSRDGIAFDDVWEVRSEELDSPSLERFALVATAAGFTLYLSFVDPVDRRWRVDAIDAADPGRFDVATRRPVLTAATTGTEGVKDPILVRAAGTEHLFASFAAARPGLAADAHATADIYNVGATTHPTGVATRAGDDATFTWRGEVLPVGAGWDRYQARLGSIVATDDGWIGTYDGSANHAENYEERCGLASSPDLRTWSTVTPDGPWWTGAAGSVRYVDLHRIDGEWWCWAEVTRPDGAHELRVVPPASRNRAERRRPNP
jgi:hypothetical protein